MRNIKKKWYSVATKIISAVDRKVVKRVPQDPSSGDAITEIYNEVNEATYQQIRRINKRTGRQRHRK